MIKEVWPFIRDYRAFVLYITAGYLGCFLLGMYWIHFEPSVIEKSWRGQLIPYTTWASPVIWAVTLVNYFRRYMNAKNNSKSSAAENSVQDHVQS
jgi:hypothetical protein